MPLPLSSQNAQRLGGSQVAQQTLTTPVVSVATPSLLAPFSSMQTAYNTGKMAVTISIKFKYRSDSFIGDTIKRFAANL